MKALLMFDDRDFQVNAALLPAAEPSRYGKQLPERDEPVGVQDLIQDLELETVWDAMADSDGLVYASARSAMLAGLVNVQQIRYRQAVLSDCLRQPDIVREIYGLAVQAVAEERKNFRGSFNERGEGLLRRSVTVLEAFLPILKQLRKLTEEQADRFASQASPGSSTPCAAS